mmetsp:Transcript_8318/g.19001  ORF Transcript_8318/g.19001 Transcript_8318/m.19001 type:complete len:614 (-) Transcript_8318:34-1875(-)
MHRRQAPALLLDDALDALLEIHVSEGPGDGQLAHHAVVDHEASRVADALGLVRPRGLVVVGHDEGGEVAAQHGAGVPHVGAVDASAQYERRGGGAAVLRVRGAAQEVLVSLQEGGLQRLADDPVQRREGEGGGGLVVETGGRDRAQALEDARRLVQQPVRDVYVQVLRKVVAGQRAPVPVEDPEEALRGEVLAAQRADVQVLHDGARVLHALPVAHLLAQAVVVPVYREARPAHQYVVVQVQLIAAPVGPHQLHVGAVRGAHVVDRVAAGLAVEVDARVLARQLLVGDAHLVLRRAPESSPALVHDQRGRLERALDHQQLQLAVCVHAPGLDHAVARAKPHIPVHVPPLGVPVVEPDAHAGREAEPAVVQVERPPVVLDARVPLWRQPLVRGNHYVVTGVAADLGAAAAHGEGGSLHAALGQSGELEHHVLEAALRARRTCRHWLLVLGVGGAVGGRDCTRLLGVRVRLFQPLLSCVRLVLGEELLLLHVLEVALLVAQELSQRVAARQRLFGGGAVHHYACPRCTGVVLHVHVVLHVDILAVQPARAALRSHAVQEYDLKLSQGRRGSHRHDFARPSETSVELWPSLWGLLATELNGARGNLRRRRRSQPSL